MQSTRPVTVSAALTFFGVVITVGYVVGCVPPVQTPAVPPVTQAPDVADARPVPGAEALGDDGGLGSFGAFLDFSFAGEESATVEMICPDVVVVARPPDALPEPLGVAVEAGTPGEAAGFVFDPNLTSRVGQYMEPVTESWSEEAAVPVQWWVFRHSGSVEEALEALEAPEFGAWMAWEASVGPVLQEYLQTWDTALRGTRGTEWLELAETRVSDWWDVHHSGAEMRFMLEDYTGVYAACGSDDEGPTRVGVFAWSLDAFSPFIDWSSLTLIEGTYVVVLRFDFSYNF